MAKILVKNNLAPAVYEFIIEAPMIAHKCQPGQFVMIRTDENSERIPLTIADFDREKGTITLIVQTVGNTTTHLCETFIVGDEILDVLGPLGMPSHMGKFGTVAVSALHRFIPLLVLIINWVIKSFLLSVPAIKI